MSKTMLQKRPHPTTTYGGQNGYTHDDNDYKRRKADSDNWGALGQLINGTSSESGANLIDQKDNNQSSDLKSLI